MGISVGDRGLSAADRWDGVLLGDGVAVLDVKRSC